MNTIEKTTTKSTFWAVALFYILIAFEFFYMASPFAAYFYGVYKPFLSFLDKFPSLSWITGFFLPHLIENTKSPFFDSLKIAGAIIASIGFLTFLVCAFQVYYAKFFKKGMVNGGLYKYIRHPQYTAFAICSFGLLLLWPRYLVLLMYISLLFAYYLLAKAEEKECENKYGDSYHQYKNQTFMFLPVKFNLRFSKSKKSILLAGFFILAILGAILAGKYLKHASIASLHSKYEKNSVYISISEITDLQINKIVKSILNDNEIQTILNKYTDTNVKLINYILPLDMYISEIPMIKPENESCHVFTSSHSTMYKVVYTKAKFPTDITLKDNTDILYYTTRLEPLIEVWYDMERNKILKKMELPVTASRYKNIPEPIF